MKCPNCGAFVEDGKQVCPICGTILSSSPNNGFGNPNGNMNNFGQNPGFNNNPGFGGMNTYTSNNVSSSFGANGFNNQNAAFGNGNVNNNFSNGNANFGNGNSAFGNGNTNFGNGNANFGNGNQFAKPNDKSERKNDYNNKFNKNYQDLDYKNVKGEEKDIFDFFSENKKVIRIVSIVAVFAIILLAGFLYNKHRMKEVEDAPILLNLYYEVDSSLESVSANSNGATVFTKTGSKGSDCSISITLGAATTKDHVNEYFTAKKTSLDPERDNDLNVINELNIFTASDSSMSINGSTWYYLNIFYRPDAKTDPLLLRYKYLTAVYKGHYYDIELVNNKNDAACNASLNNFAKSLKFIDV